MARVKSALLARPLPSNLSMLTTQGHVIVIASAPMASAWRVQLDSQPNTRIFSETDFLQALDAIISERPEVIALDPMFAATARGAALVSRVKADPLLHGSEIRTLVRDGVDSPLAAPATKADDSSPLQPQALDRYGTRRAPRYPMDCAVTAKVNGTAGRLINLSRTGSQMLAPIRLRPSEGVRLTLADESDDLRLTGTIAWASLEISAKSNEHRYRFGVDFRDADTEMLEQFCVRHRDDN
jgi:hypothetical protein